MLGMLATEANHLSRGAIMNEEDAFLRAILEEPDDEANRLIYADWLEERGDPLGEFLRVQSALTTTPLCDERRPGLLARAGELLTGHGDKWAGRLHRSMKRGKVQRVSLGRILIPAQIVLDGLSPLMRLTPFQSILVDLTGITIPQVIIEMIPESVARENVVLPLTERDDALLIVMADLADTEIIQKLCFILNREIEPVYAERQQLGEAIDRHYPGTEIETVDSMLQEFVDVERAFPWSAARLAGTDAEVNDSSVVNLVTGIILEAFALKATTIWIEPLVDRVRMRYRIEGVLVARGTLSPRLIAPIVALVRSWAVTDRADDNLSGTGRLNVNVNGERIDLGVSVLTTAHGEAVVIRIPPAAWLP